MLKTILKTVKLKNSNILLINETDYIELTNQDDLAVHDYINTNEFQSFLKNNDIRFFKNPTRQKKGFPCEVIDHSLFTSENSTKPKRKNGVLIQFHTFALHIKKAELYNLKWIVNFLHNSVSYYMDFPELKGLKSTKNSTDFFHSHKDKNYIISLNGKIHDVDFNMFKETHDFSIKLKNRSYKTFSNGFRVSSAAESREKFKSLIGEFLPIRNISPIKNIDTIGIPVYISKSTFIENDVCQNAESYTVHGGKGPNDGQAFASACGEALERFCSQRLGNEKLYTGLNKTNTKRKIDNLCIKGKIQNKHYISSLSYVSATDLLSGELIDVPAAKVFFPIIEANKEIQLGTDTTGLASGSSIEEATLQGLLECIEREAIYSHYFSNTSLPTLTGVRSFDWTPCSLIFA